MTDIAIVNALIYATLGILTFAATFSGFLRFLRIDLQKEVLQERNVAAAILAGAVGLGLAWIVAATMH